MIVVNRFRDRNVKKHGERGIFSIRFSKIHKNIKKNCIPYCIGEKNMV